jgi:CHASE2 domain-containing protein
MLKLLKIVFSVDNLLATLVVLLFLKFLPILFSIDFLDPIQNTVENFNATDIVFSQIRNKEAQPVDTNIVLVNIGNLNRKGIANQLEIINQYNPKVVGVDAFFRKSKGEAMDIPLQEVMSEIDNLVIVNKLRYNPDKKIFDSIETSHPMFLDYAEQSFANLITSEDEFRTVRTFTPKQKVNDKNEIFFALKIAQHYDKEKVDKFLARNNEVETINFKRNQDKYLTLDACEIFEKQDELDFLDDKIVLLGFMGPSFDRKVTEDIFYTSMNEYYFGKTYPDMYGVVVHANIISMVLEQDFVYTISDNVVLILSILLVFLNMIFFKLIEDKYPEWYEPANFGIVLFEIVGVIFLLINLLLHYNIEINFREVTLFGILFSPTGYELYKGSLKPIGKRFFKKVIYNPDSEY